MTEKPSRNEDEYFVRRSRAARQRRPSSGASRRERLAYMKCPKDGYDLASTDCTA